MATISTGPAGAGGGRSAPVPWWQTPGQADAANNLDKSAPPGYQYDRVQMRYVPILGSATDALAQRARQQGIIDQLLSGFGAGSGGSAAPVSYPSAIPSAPAPPMVLPSGGTMAERIPTVALPDDSAAQAANFARAKDQVGQETAGSVTALRSALAGRGLLGGGMEVKGTSNILGRGQGELGDTTRTNLTNEAKRIDDFAKLGYQGAIEQRGQDITTSEGAANRSLAAATTNYQGGVTQRGQDITQAGDKFQGDIIQRGQNVTARGQNVGALSTLLSKLY